MALTILLRSYIITPPLLLPLVTSTTHCGASYIQVITTHRELNLYSCGVHCPQSTGT